jgi:hypothetical protein
MKLTIYTVPRIRKCRALHPLPNTSSWHTTRTDLPFGILSIVWRSYFQCVLHAFLVCFTFSTCLSAGVVPCIKMFWKIPLIFKCHQVMFSALLGWLFPVIPVRAAFIVGTGHHLHTWRLGVFPTVLYIGVKSVPQQTASLYPVHTANIVICSQVSGVDLVWVN